MGIFSSGKDKELKALRQAVTRFQNQSIVNLAANINRNIPLYPEWEINDNADKYCTTDDIYSIVTRLSRTASLVPLYGYEIKEEKSYKQLKRLKAHTNLRKTKELQTKALEDLEETDPVYELLEHPHELMSKFEFFESVYSFLLLFGECFILKEKPEFGVNANKPVKLHFLFPQNVTLRVTETLPRKIVGFDYVINGQVIYKGLTPDEVIHIKYFNPDADFTGQELRGLSPLKILKRRLTRLDGNMDVSVAQMQNGGVPGIVYDKSDDGRPLDGEVTVAGQRKTNFYKYLNNPGNKGAPFFASGELGYIELGLTLADLTVAELAKIDFKKLCNVFAVSDRLFNNDATGSEVSDANAGTRLYTDAVLPNVYRVRDALINGLLKDFSDDIYNVDENGNRTLVSKGDKVKRSIECDLSDITELQEDLSKIVSSLMNAYWLTPNEKREAMKYERVDDELFDKPLLPAGLQTLDDLNAINDIPLVTPNGN